jgi:hypothetical protein
LAKSDVAEVSQPLGSGPPRKEAVADDRFDVTNALTSARGRLAFLTMMGISYKLNLRDLKNSQWNSNMESIPNSTRRGRCSIAAR